MCRYMMAEQFLGITFTNLLRLNKFQIELSIFNQIENEVDKTIRKTNNAMLCASMNEIYSAIEEYNDFFQVNESKIVVNEIIQEKILQDNEKDKFISVLNDYFITGIPLDINNVVNKILQKELSR